MKVVMDDFMLATAADIVADPSAPDAFVDGIMEGKEWIYANGAIHAQTIEQISKSINTFSLLVENTYLCKRLIVLHLFTYQ